MQISDFLRPGHWMTARGGPLYLQLRRRLEALIHAAGLTPGDPLPSERDIARFSGLSRVTVRKAMVSLAENGVILQRQGAGSFLAPRPARMEQSLSQLTSFTEEMARRGLDSANHWLARGLFPADPQESSVLALGAGDQVARLARLRLANGRPVAIEWASLSAQVLPDPDCIEASLYQALARAGHRPSRAVQRLSAVNVLGEDAAHLQVAQGAAGLQIDRVSFHADGRPIETVRSLYRGDSFDFIAELRLGGAGS